MPTEATKINWPKWVCDDIHFDCKEIDSYNKKWNVCVCERIAGKSTLMWRKVYKAMREGNTSLVFKRKVKEINDTFIEDTQRIFHKFVGDRVKLTYKKSELKNGQMDLKIMLDDDPDTETVLCRLISLGADIHDLKGAVLMNVVQTFLDECCVNRRIGEKYLPGEMDRILEVITTYQRESSRTIKNYFFGNPYSTVFPVTSFLHVDTRRMKPGALIVGDDYVLQCYQICEALKEKILKENPQFEMNAEYKKYAFGGEFLQDSNIRIFDTVPEKFHVKWYFKVDGIILGVWWGLPNVNREWNWLVRKVDAEQVGKHRDILCFDFGQMASNTILLSPRTKRDFEYLKDAICNQRIAYDSAESSYCIETIYQYI